MLMSTPLHTFSLQAERYALEASAQTMAARRRELTALSSPMLERLVRLRKDLDNAHVGSSRRRLSVDDVWLKCGGGT